MSLLLFFKLTQLTIVLLHPPCGEHIAHHKQKLTGGR